MRRIFAVLIAVAAEFAGGHMIPFKRAWCRHTAATGLLIALTAALGGCGLPGGGTLNTGTSTIGDEKGQQYAFARARLPITIVGQSTPKRLTMPGTPAFTHKVTLTIQAPKFAVDTSIAKALGRKPNDRFFAEIDNQRLLRSVSPAAAPSGAIVTGTNAQAAPAAEIADFGAILEKSLPPGPTTAVLTRTLPRQLKSFRFETEIDPAAPGELEALRIEMLRVARDWGLDVSFEPVTAEANINGRPLTLAASPGAVSCRDPICFRVPVPYRLRVEPSQTGWHGKLETHVWLPNNGPIASLDVRNQVFVDSGARATFENGMLRSLTARDALALDTLLKIPANQQTAEAVGR